MMVLNDWCLLVAEKGVPYTVDEASTDILEGEEGRVFDSIEELEASINTIDRNECVPYAFQRTTVLTPVSIEYKNIKTVSVKSVAKVVTK